MLAKEADQLKRGDRVLAYNGPYEQDSKVISVEKDYRGVRWISYWWERKGKKYSSVKRHNSVYLPETQF